MTNELDKILNIVLWETEFITFSDMLMYMSLDQLIDLQHTQTRYSNVWKLRITHKEKLTHVIDLKQDRLDGFGGGISTAKFS